MSTELFQEFSLDGDDNLLNSLDNDAGAGAPATTATPDTPPSDELSSELMDFDLDGTAGEELPIANAGKTTTTTQDNTQSDAAPEATVNTDTTNKEDEKSPVQNEVTSLYAPLASDLHEQGFLPNTDLKTILESDDPKEALFAAMGGEIDKGIESFVTSLPTEFKEQLLAHQQGVDISTYQSAQKETLELSSITNEKLSSDVNLQKKIMKANLTGKGFSEEKANKYIDNLESLNELEAESTDALSEEVAKAEEHQKNLIKEAEAQRQAAIEAQNATIAQMNKTLEETKEIIPGKALNKISREKILNSMTQIVGKDNNGNNLNAVQATRAKNPIDFEMKLHYLNSLGVFDGDWSSITKTAKTQAISSLDKKLQDVYSFEGNKNVKPGAPEEKGSSILDLFK
jgi:hypothetical protein